MGIRVIREDDMPWTDGSEYVKDGVSLRTHSRFPIAHFEETGPWLGRARYDAGMVVKAHWHPCNEILYITHGQITIGDETYGPGTTLAIDEGTVYGPIEAGPEGAQFLTIRDRHPKGLMKPQDATASPS